LAAAFHAASEPGVAIESGFNLSDFLCGLVPSVVKISPKTNPPHPRGGFVVQEYFDCVTN
jgi:hypothetical protein